MSRTSDGSGRRKAGRPAKQVNASASVRLQLAADLRRLRVEQGLTLVELGRLVDYSSQHLSAVERGEVAPAEPLVARCDQALNAAGQLIARFPAVVREKAADRHERETARHQRARSAAGSTPLDLDWARLAAVGGASATVSPEIVADLELITDRQRVLYHQLSSTQLLVPVETQLGLLLSLLKGCQPQSLRRRIAAAASKAAGFAAWIWYDLGDDYKSNLYYQRAESLIAESQDTALGSYISAYRALACEGMGLLPEAHRHAETALATAPKSISRQTRAWLSAVNAAAFALVPARRTDARRLLADAQDLLDAAAHREEWMYDFDRAALAGYSGTAFLRMDDPGSVAAAFSEGISALPHSCERRGAQLKVGLAEAHLRTGKIDVAVAAATDALEVFAMRGSVSGIRRVRRFRDVLGSLGEQSRAHELDELVRARLRAVQ
ncbi:helix-turn-helix domain-containing protein [Actinomadura oligospora]|uniref:helix-turn-helix domain-containing protein n=1 Tax=Actinomadura oligospora TaxID=111804 RepID=UPI0004B12B7A|nr:helix-turn-helix transcriptional regulator [Actinomadura oligospora]